MKNIDILFEISWEVCNKVGGIHTVIASKAQTIINYVQNYYVIGPYIKEKNPEFLPENPPYQFHKAISTLKELGIKIHFGKWNIPGNPNAILVEYLDYSKHINEIKTHLWDEYKIDSLNSDWYDFDEVLLWSWCCGIVVEKLSECINNLNSNIFLHAHEWIAGGAIFYIKTLKDSKFRTVFTTHATMLGRALCGIGQNLYELEDKIDADQKAYELNIYTKQQTEKALANHANAFTTVSRITAKETKNFYKKFPDRLLFNGFDNPDSNFEENMQHKFNTSRKKLNDFLVKYFFQYYELDLNNTFVLYTSGRNEFRNKGVDLMIKALGKLNRKLKEEKSEKNIVSMFLIPIGNFKKDSRLDNDITEDMKSSLWEAAPLSTHFVPSDNEIIKAFIGEQLFNRKEDKVKVILIPIYLQEEDAMFNQTYYDTIVGMDLGIFASFYEPWGYTPLESISFGVPTITSDLAGFGRTVEKEFGGNKAGVKVLKRETQSYEESVNELYEYLCTFIQKTKAKLEIEKKGAYIFSKNFSWELFIKNYLKAYEIAKNKVKIN